MALRNLPIVHGSLPVVILAFNASDWWLLRRGFGSAGAAPGGDRGLQLSCACEAMGNASSIFATPAPHHRAARAGMQMLDTRGALGARPAVPRGVIARVCSSSRPH